MNFKNKKKTSISLQNYLKTGSKTQMSGMGTKVHKSPDDRKDTNVTMQLQDVAVPTAQMLKMAQHLNWSHLQMLRRRCHIAVM